MDIGRIKSVRKKYGNRKVLSVAKYKSGEAEGFNVALKVKGNNKFNRPIILTLGLDEIKPNYLDKYVMELINNNSYDELLTVGLVLVDEKDYEKPIQKGEE